MADTAKVMSLSKADILELTARQVARAIAERSLRAVDYAEMLLARIEATAALGAFVAIDPDAVQAAARNADRKVAAGDPLGPLHGVPLAVKDNIDAAGLPAAAGTPALAANRPRADAAVLAPLRAAGAILLGKTNMHELAAGVTTNNAHFGTAHNPYDMTRVPGGSSGGTAIAVAARLAPVALGTDTGASNRLPAAFCGVVGFRPTTGRWPQSGMILNSPTRDTAGPMARDVADCALLDALVTGDAATPEPALENLRLGVPRAAFWDDLDPRVASACEDALARLRDAGVTLIEMNLPGIHELTAQASTVIAMYEHPLAMEAYLAASGSGLAAAEVFSAIASPDVRHFVDACHGQFTEMQYRAALKDTRPRLQALYREAYARGRLDALIFPTAPIPAPRIGLEEDEIDHRGQRHQTLLLAIRNTNPGSVAGVPGISLPAGVVDGLPIGIELDGRSGDDRRLLAIAQLIERVLPSTPPPAL